MSRTTSFLPREAFLADLLPRTLWLSRFRPAAMPAIFATTPSEMVVRPRVAGSPVPRRVPVAVAVVAVFAVVAVVAVVLAGTSVFASVPVSVTWPVLLPAAPCGNAALG